MSAAQVWQTDPEVHRPKSKPLCVLAKPDPFFPHSQYFLGLRRKYSLPPSKKKKGRISSVSRLRLWDFLLWFCLIITWHVFTNSHTMVRNDVLYSTPPAQGWKKGLEERNDTKNVTVSLWFLLHFFNLKGDAAASCCRRAISKARATTIHHSRLRMHHMTRQVEKWHSPSLAFTYMNV